MTDMTTSRMIASTGLVLLIALMGYAAIAGTGDDSSEGDLAVAADAAPDDGQLDGQTSTTAAADDSDVSTSTSSTSAAPAVEAPPFLGEAKAIEGLDGWLQTDVTTFEEIDAPVRVVQFWTFGCFNCKNTLGNMAELYALHKDDGLEVIGVHTPEFDYEKDPDAIAAAAVELNVTWPIALDTNKKNFRSWQGSRRFWPRTYVLDADDNIRFDHIGEGAYDELNATVAWLIENQA